MDNGKTYNVERVLRSNILSSVSHARSPMYTDPPPDFVVKTTRNKIKSPPTRRPALSLLFYFYCLLADQQ